MKPSVVIHAAGKVNYTANLREPAILAENIQMGCNIVLQLKMVYEN